MAGNWIDNTACIGQVGGENVVFVDSHDYRLYAFDARSGEQLWSRALGGEIYSAPAFFHLEGEPAVTAACLDNRLYVVNAANGELLSAYYIGEPIWDHAPKGEALLGSPSVIEAGRQTVIVHGSYNGAICILPLLKKCAFRDQSKSLLALWLSLPILLVLFLGVILPILLRIP